MDTIRNTSATNTPVTGSDPMTTQERVYRDLRARIMHGRFSPGRAVTIRGLAEELAVSMTPVREALRRLVSEQALEMLANRRVAVPKMTAEKFQDLTEARVALESLAARRALPHAGPELADELERIDTELEHAIEVGDADAYIDRNMAFHFTLYRASPGEVLMPLIESLWLQIGPFMHLTRHSLGVTYIEDRHEDATAAIRAGDADALAIAIEKDIRDGMGSLPPGRLPFD